MPHPDLRERLYALAHGDLTALDEVRAGLREHPLGEGLDLDTLFVASPQGDAAALLAVVDGVRDAGLAAALRGDAAAAPDVAGSVMAALFAEAWAEPEVLAAEAAPSVPLLDGLDGLAEVSAEAVDPPLPVTHAVAAEAGDGPELAVEHDPQALPVARALHDEAGAGPELARAHDPTALPLRDALVAEAGTVSVVEPVLATVIPEALPEGWVSAMLDASLPPSLQAAAAARVASDPAVRSSLAAFAEVGRQVRQATMQGAGAVPPMWARVAPGIGIEDPEAVPGWDEALLVRTIGEHAGQVDVADAVYATIGRELAPAAPVEAPAPAPEPAGFTLPGWLIGSSFAFVALLVVAYNTAVFWIASQGPAFIERDTTEFATADELSVDRVSYGAQASVFVELPTEAGDPVLIWVDEGGAE